MYSIKVRIGITDVDSDGRLTVPAIIDYFQNCCTFQSEDLGLGINYLKDEGLVWVLTSWQVDIDRYPFLGDYVEIHTIPYDIKGFMGFRNFYIVDSNGEVIVKANTLWTLLSIHTGKPARVNETMINAYGKGTKIDMEYAPRKITLIDDSEVAFETSVMRHQLDTNKHMNNGQYLHLAYSLLPEGKRISEMRAEYRAQALLGDLLVLNVGEDSNRTVVTINNDKNAPYAVFEFKY